MGDRHVWHNGYDWVVATDIEDARRVHRETCGELSDEDRDGDGWEQWPDDRMLKINDEDIGPVTKTCAEWVASDVCGFLCSTEL